jgi:hypothetical protein
MPKSRENKKMVDEGKKPFKLGVGPRSYVSESKGKIRARGTLASEATRAESFA